MKKPSDFQTGDTFSGWFWGCWVEWPVDRDAEGRLRSAARDGTGVYLEVEDNAWAPNVVPESTGLPWEEQTEAWWWNGGVSIWTSTSMDDEDDPAVWKRVAPIYWTLLERAAAVDGDPVSAMLVVREILVACGYQKPVETGHGHGQHMRYAALVPVELLDQDDDILSVILDGYARPEGWTVTGPVTKQIATDGLTGERIGRIDADVKRAHTH